MHRLISTSSHATLSDVFQLCTHTYQSNKHPHWIKNEKGKRVLQSGKTMCLDSRAIILGFLGREGTLVPLSVFWALALQSVEVMEWHWYTRKEDIFDFSVGEALFFLWWCLCARVEYLVWFFFARYLLYIDHSSQDAS